MNGIEGKITIDLFPQRAKNEQVKVTSSRPVQASRVLIGKTPEQALSIIPLLFSICGIAQSHTALSALQKCLGIESNATEVAAHNMLVLIENAKEHLLRIALDWPKLFSLEPDVLKLSYLSQLTGQFRAALYEQGLAFQLNSVMKEDFNEIESLIDSLEMYMQTEIFHRPTNEWLKIDNLESFIQWAKQGSSPAAYSSRQIFEQNWAAQGQSTYAPLPQLNNETLIEHFEGLQASHFIAHPQWSGNCYETSALARQSSHPLISALTTEFGSGLLTRWTARLTEVAGIPSQLREYLKLMKSNATPSGSQHAKSGLSQTETARGRLIHHVQMKDGIISDYHILAPTEWNFHPEGLITQSLANISTEDKQEREKIAHTIINAIDPCVDYDLRIHHA